MVHAACPWNNQFSFVHAKNAENISVENVVDKIRGAINARRARTDDYLKDYDRLRTGYISKAQFDRCLDQHYGVVLKPEEDYKLMLQYGSDANHPGMVNYRSFCKAIDRVNDPLHSKPETPSKLSQPRLLSPDSLSRCDEILKKIAPYYKYHGLNIRSSYEDFDQHNIGLVTESQFYRRFPGPPDITMTEQTLLAKKYIHPSKPGLCRYLDFHQDIEKLINIDETSSGFDLVGNQANEMPGRKSRQGTSIDEIFDKIRVAVHKYGIRTTEFFIDHDKLRSGVITRSQFNCGLSLCCGKQANLSRDEIEMVMDYYQTDDGRVQYKEFCHLMENAFNVPDLEKKPTADVFRPPTGALAKMPNQLSNAEEEKVAKILQSLHETVSKRRLMLYPYFKDFDRGNCYTRGITRTQFSRMLHMVGLDLPPGDLDLICRKFEYLTSGDINYPAFIQAIDSEYRSNAPVTGDWNTTMLPLAAQQEEVADKISEEKVDELIKRIRHHVLVNRIRIEEFFQDFDPLRHGSISTSRFRMGLSAMGQKDLTEKQIIGIVNRYADPKRKYNCLWTNFLKDIEIVFTQRGLEKTRRLVLPPAEQFHMSKPGAINWDEQPAEKRAIFDDVMHKMRQKAKQRRILTKPVFQDFDKHNNGYVTRSQMRQCIAYLCFDCTTEESDIVYERFSDDFGFNYLKYLEDLQPSEKQENKYLQRLENLKLVNRSKSVKSPEFTNIETVMNKIKSTVVRQSVRVYEFMKDYDKLRTGRMSKTNFPRAIDLCNLGLSQAEIEVIMDAYTSSVDSDYVNFYEFCDDVESAFTQKGLEKNPTAVPTQFRPNTNSLNIKLSPEAEEMFESVMHRLGDRVRIRRIQLFPLFEDYDRVHNGTCSRSQFHRVLSELELGSLVSAREFHVLYEKFDSVIGGKHDFNYIQFCEMLNDYAHFEPNVP